MAEHQPDTSENFLQGGGITGQLIRSKDWTKTPLGAPAFWPESLKICVRIILTSSQPMFVWWGNELINIYNDAYISIVGGKHPESLGIPAYEVWKEIWHEIGPRVKTVMHDNTGTYDEALLLLMERNGYTEETYYTFSYSPVPGTDGTTQGIICANTDDTQRIIAGRQLQTLRELAKNLFNITNNTDIYKRTLESLSGNPQDFPFVVLYEISDDGQLLKLTGKTPENLPEAMAFPEIDMRERANELPELSETIATGKFTNVLNLIKRFGEIPTTVWDRSPDNALLIPIMQTNHKFPFALLCVGINPYRLLDDNYNAFFNLVADQIGTALTNAYAFKQERKRAESLAEIDKAKTLFFSNISHEFRTPLTLMLGPIEEMINNDGKNVDADRFNLEIAHRNAIRLLRLVNALLDFSRIESGRAKAKFQSVDLGILTRDIVSSFRSLMEKAGLQLVTTIELSSEVYVDKEMWEKIILNLLSNAFKYTLKGTVSVSLFEVQKQVVLEVTDTGCGIPESEIKHLFERFHRVKNAVGRSYEGSGIGLSLIKELVKQHGGNISATSIEGKGTTFKVTIPLGKEHLPIDQMVENTSIQDDIISNYFVEEAERFLSDKTANTETTETLEKKPTVLIVEDNLDMRDYISKLLEKEYKVIVTSNGQQALQQISKGLPNLVISDIMMPVMDGIELMTTLKSKPNTKKIPIILLSARSGEEAKIEGYNLGADDYLVKPFSAKELLARVRSQIRIANSRDHIDKQIHNLFLQAPIALCILRGPQMIVETANDNMLEIWGKSYEEVVDKPIFKGLPDAANQGFEELLFNVYHTGKTFIAEELPIKLKRNGEEQKIYVKFVYQALYDEENNISGVMVLADDITERVTFRKKIESSELRYKLAIDAAEIGSFEWNIETSDFVYTERLAKIFGFGVATNLKQCDFSARIHPEDLGIRAEAHQKAIKNGLLFYEARVIWPNNEIHWLRLNGKIVFENDKPSKMYGTALDITDHKTQSAILEQKVADRTQNLIRKNEQLKKSEERYQRMTEEVQDYAILLLDKTGIILNWNKGAEKIKGYKEKEIIGKHIEIFYLPEDQKNRLPYHLINQATEHGRAIHEGYRIRKDGSIFWGSITLTALHDKNDNVIGFSKVTRDLTERKIAEDKLYKYNAELQFQNKELEQFAYVASHDLQEPLRKIQMFADLLEKNIGNQELSNMYFGKINSSAARMTELIKAVLNYSRLSKSEQQFEETSLNDVLQNVLVDFELLIDEKKAIINYPALPVIDAIPLQINQMFSNLLGNSLKFSENVPEITISCQKVSHNEIPFNNNLQTDTSYLELIFSDRGIGFDQVYADKVFTIFQRLHDRFTYSGTGIGLALCKRIVENHAGYIAVKSKPKEGTSFFIYLPIDKKQHAFENLANI